MLHRPVMLDAVIEALQPRPGGVYVDATYGRGGHSAALLERIGPDGQVYALDRDPEAVAHARLAAAGEPRLVIRHGSFEMLRESCEHWGIAGRVDGLLFDLGVSSPQFDTPERGFSFQHDGPLDMRMDTSGGMTAAEWLNEAAEADIAEVLWRYGEERFSRRIARRIVRERDEAPVTTTARLAGIVAAASPRTERHKHPATRTFQAVRIFINRELESLEAALAQSLDVLARGGRLAVISFHSLEDRLVKRFIREGWRGRELPRGLPVREVETERTLRPVGKAVRADSSEVETNPRARSAVLRVAEKL